MTNENAYTTTSPAPAPVIAIQGLTKTYRSVNAVDDLSFEVHTGQVTGLLGPNGAGKTTVMKMLLGLVRPTAGNIRVLGADYGSPEFPHAIRRVGALIEAPAIYEGLSARQNLQIQARLLGVSNAASCLDELLDLVDLRDRADDRTKTYSLGMKQRLGIAVAMIGRPELVILDEPANGLDPAGILEIRNLLRRLPDMGTSVLVSSHQLSEVQQVCDNLIVLHKGRHIRSGTPDQIVQKHSDRDYTVRLDASDLNAAIDHFHDRSIAVNAGATDSIIVTLPVEWTAKDLNRTLAEAGIYAVELIHEKATLESAFLELTGANNDLD